MAFNGLLKTFEIMALFYVGGKSLNNLPPKFAEFVLRPSLLPSLVSIMGAMFLISLKKKAIKIVEEFSKFYEFALHQL